MNKGFYDPKISVTNEYANMDYPQPCRPSDYEVDKYSSAQVSKQLTFDDLEGRIDTLVSLFEDTLKSLYHINSVFEGAKPSEVSCCDSNKVKDGYLNRVNDKLEDLIHLQALINNEIDRQKRLIS